MIRLLSHLKLRFKLALLIGLSALAFLASIGVAASLMHERMIDDRIDKLRAITKSAMGFAEALEAEVQEQRISREQALARFRDEVHRVRFGDDGDYLLLQTFDGIVVMHGGDPTREGKPTASKDDAGRSTAVLIQDALRNADAGVISYLALKPGQAVPQAKLSYVARFAPWRMVFIVGAWTDDVDARIHATLRFLGLIGGGILAVMLSAAWLVERDISISIGNLKAAMERLATGDLSAVVPGVGRRDEVGGMAQAVLVFKDHMAKEKQLTAEQSTDRHRAEAEKQTALIAMAEGIETETNAVLKQVGARTAAIAAAADSMHASAARTGVSADTAAEEADQALANAQMVASAAEQLASSIRGIGSQAGQSTAVVARAVEAAVETRRTIDALNEHVGRIGAVADIIGAIAAKTNLLALNATIEAARAGAAGKGFAVVAGEVKALATQTARSTQEIIRQIGEVRAATGASVAAVVRIEQTIDAINAIAESIAVAVRQQGVATAEIARNVAQTAAAASGMMSRAGEVSVEALETGRHAIEVRDDVSTLSAAMDELRQALIRFVRTSVGGTDRRAGPRHPVDLECLVNIAGRSTGTARFD